MARMTTPIHIDSSDLRAGLWTVWASVDTIEGIKKLEGVLSVSRNESVGYWYVRVDPRYDQRELRTEMVKLALAQANKDRQA